jgi:uncharacterized membrane protein YhaH (DUF805 family)
MGWLSFKGRASVPDVMSVFGSAIVVLVTHLALQYAFVVDFAEDAELEISPAIMAQNMTSLWFLACCLMLVGTWPLLATGWRRMEGRGRSGLWAGLIALPWVLFWALNGLEIIAYGQSTVRLMNYVGFLGWYSFLTTFGLSDGPGAQSGVKAEIAALRNRRGQA